SAGHFAFVGVPAGEYGLHVKKVGFDDSQGRVSLHAGQTLTRDVALQIGEIEETIRVTVTQTASKPAQTTAREPYAFEVAARGRCAQTVVGGCIVPPAKLKDVRPVYPQSKRDAGIEGKV